MAQTRNLRDGVLTIKDGTGTPNTLTVALDSGDLTWTQRQNRVQVMDRGSLDPPRAGDEAPVSVSFSVKLDRVSEASSPVTVYDALTRTRSASTWNTTGVGYEGYMVILAFVINDPEPGGSDDETITFNKFFHEALPVSEGDEFNTLEVSGVDFETSPTYT